MAKGFQRDRNPKNIRGISPVISTVIISGTLLIVLAIASFVSMNILELQLASTEFEQAKSNMLLLDEVIHDVAMRRGSGGYVQFNQRAGGIGIIEEETLSITITNSTRNETFVYHPYSIIYRGGSFASGSEMVLRPLPNSTGSEIVPSLIVNMTDMLSYIRVEFDEGIRIKLDYNRIRIIDMGEYNITGGGSKKIIGLNFIILKMRKENVGPSGTIYLKVKNNNTITRTYENVVKITVQRAGGEKKEIQLMAGTVVIFTEIEIEISKA